MVEPAPEPDERSGRSLWLWPVVAIVLTAVAGQLLGVTAALLAGAGAVAAAVWMLGSRLFSRRSHRTVALISMVAGVLITTGGVIQQRSVPFEARAGQLSTGPMSPVSSASPSAPAPGRLDLSGRRLSREELSGLDLRHAVIRGSVLDGLDLRGRDLSEVDAAGASFVGVRMDGARLRRANLSGASFRRSCLRGADLSEAKVHGVDATGADVTGASAPPTISQEASSWPAARALAAPGVCR